jgi:glycine/serine hydroxymethyltransferase
VTSRGFRENEIERVARIISGALREKEGFSPDPYKREVSRLCREHPLYLNPLETPNP